MQWAKENLYLISIIYKQLFSYLLATTYEIRVRTGTRYNAPTDANVFIQLHGDMRDSKEIPLIDSNHSNLFEQAQTDVFQIMMPNIGNLIKITMSHDKTGDGPSWYLEDVIIVDTDTAQSWKCETFGWLSKTTAKSSNCEKGIVLRNYSLITQILSRRVRFTW